MASTIVNNDENTFSSTSSIYKRLQWTYIVGHAFAGAAESLQGSYQYALYSSYGFSRATIELFYFISYVSALLFGTSAASLSDRYGRRLACFLAGLFLSIKCITQHFPQAWILIIGCIAWGIGNAYYHSGFEAWLIQEHHDRHLDPPSLIRILRNSYIITRLISACTGILAQFLTKFNGYTTPFDASILFFILMFIFISQFWSENFGNKQVHPLASFISAFHLLCSDPRIGLLLLSDACFSAALYTFVTEWTPMLTSSKVNAEQNTIPLGYIFAAYMLFDMLGNIVFGRLVQRIHAQSYLIVVACIAAVSILPPIITPHSFFIILCGFCLFEFCVGIQQPSIAYLRSLYIPNEVRATMINYGRVPQIIFMIFIFLSHLSLSTIFIICLVLNLISAMCMICLRSSKMPNEHGDNHGEQYYLPLDEPSSLLFLFKRNNSDGSTSSLMAQASIQSQDDE